MAIVLGLPGNHPGSNMQPECMVTRLKDTDM